MTRSKVTLSEFREYLQELRTAAGVLSCVIVACAAVSIAVDMHGLRSEQLAASVELQHGLFARLDSFLWKADTFLTLEAAKNKLLSNGLTQVRVQVQQASSDQERAIKSASVSTEKAVEKTLVQTASVIEQAAATSGASLAPVVNVEPAEPAAAAAPPQVVVNPVLTAPRVPVHAPVTTEKKSHWRWLRYLWPFRHARND